jgi:hypothetical protein
MTEFCDGDKVMEEHSSMCTASIYEKAQHCAAAASTAVLLRTFLEPSSHQPPVPCMSTASSLNENTVERPLKLEA